MLQFHDLLPGAHPLTREDPTAFSPPPAFGPFRVLHQVGVGALGPVFRTYEPTRDRLVAVKVFRLDIVPEQAQSLADELSRATEAGLFHPSIVEPIAAGVEGTLAYRAEEYVAAESLDVAMRHYAPAPIEKALPFMTQLAGAIDFARAAGVRHGGLHPRDIFVTPDEARATGFGVVEALERAGIRAPVRRPYSAPERIDAAEWGTPADVFALAAITFELLTGRRPAGTGDRIGALNETTSPHANLLHGVLARAMDEDPARRYPTALAFAAALESAARGASVTPVVVPMPSTASEEREATGEERKAKGEERGETDEGPGTSDQGLGTKDQGLGTRRSTPLFEEGEPAAVMPIVSGREPIQVDPIDSLSLHAAPEPEPEPGEPVVRPSIVAPPSIRTEPAAPRPPEIHEEPVPMRFSADERPYAEETSSAESHDVPERSRPAVLPVAVVLIAGLLLGFMAGYFVGGRETIPPQASATTATGGSAATLPPAPASNAPSSRAPAPSPSSGSSQAAATPPTVPEDSPPASSKPNAPASSGSAARTTPPAPVAPTGRIVVRSNPEKAGVTINGRWRGRTPLTLENLPFGKYTVKVVQPGYKAEQSEFSLSSRETSRSLNLRLAREAASAPARSTGPAPARSGANARSGAGAQEPAQNGGYTGTLFVDSRPQGAAVLLDGHLVGKTPLRLPDVRIGSHVVRLELAEHQAWTASTRVSAGQESRVTGSLERLQ